MRTRDRDGVGDRVRKFQTDPVTVEPSELEGFTVHRQAGDHWLVHEPCGRSVYPSVARAHATGCEATR